MTDVATRVKVRAQVLGCSRCGLRSNCTKPVPFSGRNPSPIVIVGEAPGAEEDSVGRPFVGPSGRLLRRTLDSAMDDNLTTANGPFSASVAYLNVVSCYPHRTPHSSEVEECKDNLSAQLKALTPWYGLVVGGIAVSSWWPKIRIGDLRGRWWKENGYREDEKYTWFLATWHPSAVLRSGGLNSRLGKEFQADLMMFATVIADHKRPGLNVDCVRCGRGERKGKAQIWERNVGVCQRCAPHVGFAGYASSAERRPRTRQAKGKAFASSPRSRGSNATPTTLFGD